MATQTETAILVGDCFWGMQDLLGLSRRAAHSCRLQRRRCVNATYRNHAEAIEIVFDFSVISYGRSLSSSSVYTTPARPTVKATTSARVIVQ